MPPRRWSAKRSAHDASPTSARCSRPARFRRSRLPQRSRSLYLVFGRSIIALFTNQEAVRSLAAQFLPWLIVLPLVAVWSFLLDGVFIGATRAQELRDSMVIALAGFLALAVVLTAHFGNHGLWCAMLAFMALRAMTLALRLPGIERKSFAMAENPVEA